MSDLELHANEYYEVYDPDEAQVVAVFTAEVDARAYMAWRSFQRDFTRCLTEGYRP